MFDEKNLNTQCRAGNRVAEKQLYDTYSRSFYGICLRYADSEAEAEDMLITGFTLILTKLSSFQGKGSFVRWMKNIIIHNALDLIKQRPRWDCVDELPQTGVSDPPLALPHLEVEELLLVMRKLPALYRHIFNLYAVEGFAHSEIAGMLEMNESTVRVYYSKAKRMLQELLKDYRKDGTI